MTRKYGDLTLLASGASAVVYSANSLRRTSDCFAIKCVSKAVPAADPSVEIEILSCLSHDNIVKYHFSMEDDTYTYLFLDLVRGGDVFDYLVKDLDRPYVESLGANFMRCLLRALAHMHKVQIVHRDVKPENLCLVRKGDPSAIKLIDFGAACVIEGAGYGTVAFTEKYAPPETSVAPAWDMWSAGVVMHLLMNGSYPPTPDASCGGVIVDRSTAQCSSEACDLIEQLLRVDPAERVNAQQALAHPYITQDRPLELSDAHRSIRAMRRWKKAANVMKFVRKLSFDSDTSNNEE